MKYFKKYIEKSTHFPFACDNSSLAGLRTVSEFNVKFARMFPVMKREKLLWMSSKVKSNFDSFSTENFIDFLLDLAVLMPGHTTGYGKFLPGLLFGPKTWGVEYRKTLSTNIILRVMTDTDNIKRCMKKIHVISKMHSIFKPEHHNDVHKTSYARIDEIVEVEISHADIISLARYACWRKSETGRSLDMPVIRRVKSQYTTEYGYEKTWPI